MSSCLRMPVAPGISMLARDLGERGDAHFLERREIERYLFGGGGGGGGGRWRLLRPAGRSSVAISSHSSFNPSPVWTETAQHRTFV